jgi:hypothetical protein
MPRDGAGNFSQSIADFVAGTVAVADDVNARFADAEAEVTNSVAADGQTTMTGALKMGSQRVTGLGDAQARTDAAKVSQIQDAAYVTGTTGGTANAQTLTPSPPITVYVTNMKFRALIGSGLTNTGPMTLQVSGIASPKNVKRLDGSALIGNECKEGCIAEFVYDGTNLVLIGGIVPSLEIVETKSFSSSASIEFTFPTGYAIAEFEGYDLLPASQDASLRAQVSIAASYQTTGNYTNHIQIGESGTFAGSLTTTDTWITVSYPCDDNQPHAVFFTGRLFNPANASVYKRFHTLMSSSLRSNGTRGTIAGVGFWGGSTGALDKIKFIWDSGNGASGTICARYRRVS